MRTRGDCGGPFLPTVSGGKVGDAGVVVPAEVVLGDAVPDAVTRRVEGVVFTSCPLAAVGAPASPAHAIGAPWVREVAELANAVAVGISVPPEPDGATGVLCDGVVALIAERRHAAEWQPGKGG